MTLASYSLGFLWKPLTIAGFVMFAVVGVLLVIPGGLIAEKPPLLFVIVWLFAFIWNAYWWLLRMSSRLEIGDGTLRWTTPLLHGEVDSADVRQIERSWFSNQVSVIKLASGRTIMTMT